MRRLVAIFFVLCFFVEVFGYSKRRAIPSDIQEVMVLDKDITLASQLIYNNTTYVIKYIFELSGDITMPENCILKFVGGRIEGNSTITGKNTGIDADITQIFGDNISLSGSWNVEESCPEWFGAKGNGIIDDTRALQAAVRFNLNGNNKTYAISNINLEGHDIRNAGFVCIGKQGCVLTARNKTNFTIDRITINCKNNAECCLILDSCKNVTIMHSDFYGVNCSGPNYINGIYINKSEKIGIENSEIHDIYTSKVSTNNGGASRAITAVNSVGVTIEKCEIYNIGGSVTGGLGDAVQFIAQSRYGYLETESNNTINECVFYNNNYRHIKIQQFGCIVKNNLIKIGKIEPAQSCIAIYDCYCRCEGNTINTDRAIPILVGAINNDLTIFRDILITKNIIKTRLEENSAIFLSNCELIEKINIIDNICACYNGCNFLNIRTNISNLICTHNNVEGCSSLVNIKKGTIKYKSAFVRNNILIEGNVINNLGNFIVYLDEDNWCENVVIVNNIGIASKPSRQSSFMNSFAGPNNLRVTKKKARVNGNIINAEYIDGSVK